MFVGHFWADDYWPAHYWPKVGADVLAAPLLVRAPTPDYALERVELWTDVQANGGRRLGVIRNYSTPHEAVNLAGEHTVSLVVPMDHPIVRLQETDPDQPNLRVDQVIRFVYTDESFTEHRISEPVRRNVRGARSRILVARSILQDLAFRGTISRTTGDGSSTTDFEALSLTMRQHMESFIIPATVEGGQTFWTVGTLEHENPNIDMVYKASTPLAALREMGVKGGDLELSVTGFEHEYQINLVKRIGAGLSVLEVRANKNLTDLGLADRSEDMATRVYALGAPDGDVRPNLGKATWDVIGITDNPDGLVNTYDITLADPAGGPGPIRFDGQFLPLPVGAGEGEEGEVPPGDHYHLEYVTGGVFLAPIVATFAGTQRVRVQSVTAPPISFLQGNSRAKIVQNALSRENLYVDHPDFVKASENGGYGVRVMHLDRPDIPGTDNLVPNPFARIWPANSQVPTGWTKADAGPSTLVRETSPRYWEHGGNAVLVSWPQYLGAVPLLTPYAKVPYTAKGYLSFFVRVTTLVGRVQVQFYIFRALTDPVTGAATPSFPWAGGGTGWQYVTPANTGSFENDVILPDVTSIQLNTPEDIGIAAAWDLSRYPLYGGECVMQILPWRGQVGPTTAVVSAAQVTISSHQMPLLEGNGGVRLHQAANERLGRYAVPAPIVTVNMVDLSVLGGQDPRLQVGRPIRVRDPDSDVEAVDTRIVGWSRDWDNRGEPQLELSNERRDITTLLAARRSAVRHPVRLVPGGTRGLTYEE